MANLDEPRFVCRKIDIVRRTCRGSIEPLALLGWSVDGEEQDTGRSRAVPTPLGPLRFSAPKFCANAKLRDAAMQDLKMSKHSFDLPGSTIELFLSHRDGDWV
jgi:hypothetical protein